jgi:hypothetical protein
MNKTLAIASICIIIALLSSILYFINAIESYKLQILELQQEIAELKEDMRFSERPYLTTSLGWYLHDSRDIVPESRNKLAIYGEVENAGNTKAYNCKLIVTFYDKTTLLQTSEINLGDIASWSQIYINPAKPLKIDCGCADSVTRIEVERTWTNTP